MSCICPLTEVEKAVLESIPAEHKRLVRYIDIVETKEYQPIINILPLWKPTWSSKYGYDLDVDGEDELDIYMNKLGAYTNEADRKLIRAETGVFERIVDMIMDYIHGIK